MANFDEYFEQAYDELRYDYGDTEYTRELAQDYAREATGGQANWGDFLERNTPSWLSSHADEE